MRARRDEFASGVPRNDDLHGGRRRAAASRGGDRAIGAATTRAQSPLLLEIRSPPDSRSKSGTRAERARDGCDGTLFVGSAAGKVYVSLPPPGTKEKPPSAIASGREPDGVAFRDGALYVSAVSRILRFDDIERRLADPPAPVVFIAERGSWNRSRKIGFRVTMVTLAGDKAVRYEPFAEGWLQGERAWGRPADVLVAADGSLLVSDDQAGAIYRVRYRGQ
jgi:hypothetical protein